MDQKKPQSPKKKTAKDPLFRIKYLGYNMSQLPPDFKFPDFVRFCKFQLCVATGRLMKDPIWNQYTPEAIMTEFFAHKFVKDEDFRSQFEFAMEFGKSLVDDFAAWADQEIEKSRKERGDLRRDTEDRVVFDPADVMGE